MRSPWIRCVLAVACLLPNGCERSEPVTADRTLPPPGTHHPVSLAWNHSVEAPVVGCTDGRVLIWEEPGLRPRVLETGSSAPVTALALLPDGSLIAGTADGRLYSAASGGGRERRFDPQEAAVRAIALHPQAQRTLQFTIALGDGRLVFVDASGSQAVSSQHKGGARCALYAPTGETLVTAGDDGRVGWWSVSTRRRTSVTEAHRTAIGAAAWLGGGRWLVTGDWNGRLVLWAAETRAVVADAEQPDAVADIAVKSPSEFVTGSWDGRLRLWRVEPAHAPAPRLRMTGQVATGRAIERVVLTSDSKFAVTVGDGRAVQFWDLDRSTGQLPASH